MINKKLLIIAISSLIIFSVVNNISIPTVKAEEAGLFGQQKLTAHLLINFFLEKVDHERLLIHGRTIIRSDLKPHQVSYIYNIDDDSLSARLFFKFKKVMLVPGFDEYNIDGIIVEMDKDGNITEVSTQVSRLSKKDPE